MRLLLDENLDWRLRRDLLDHQVEIGSADRMGRDREWRTITQSSRGWIRCARDDGQQHGAPAEHWAACNRGRRVTSAVESIG